MSVLTGVTHLGRHNILVVPPQHQPSIWKTQRTASIQTKTRSRVVIAFSCNATRKQLSTQHMQVVRKAVQMIHTETPFHTLWNNLGLPKCLLQELQIVYCVGNSQSLLKKSISRKCCGRHCTAFY